MGTESLNKPLGHIIILGTPMVPFNQGSQSALQTSTTLPSLLLILLLIYFFHFTGEEPEAQKEKVICCRSYNENQPGVK